MHYCVKNIFLVYSAISDRNIVKRSESDYYFKWVKICSSGAGYYYVVHIDLSLHQIHKFPVQWNSTATRNSTALEEGKKKNLIHKNKQCRNK